MQQFYFYRHHAGDPYFNMAFDETMLDYVLNRPDVILLRVYSWALGTITVGFNQEVERAVRRSRLGATPLIRRVTGGRAVYHDVSELTYAVAVNPESSFGASWRGSITDVYLLLAKTLQSFLDRMGVTARVVRKSSEPRVAPGTAVRQPCFASAARYELLAESGKIVASAQRRIGNSLLQHGSIKLSGIARHIALAGVGDTDVEPQPLDKRQLDHLAAQFAQTWETIVGGPPHTAPPDLEGTERFRRRLDTVRTRPLSRRDTFEHS